MSTATAENRQYAGNGAAAELQVSSGTFVTVVHRDLSDEQAAALGYSFDADEAAEQGKTFALRTVTISGDLADALGDVDSWPKSGGVADPDRAADDPSHPARQTYETFDGEQLSPGELNDRVQVAAEADDAAELEADEAEQRRVEQQREQSRIERERRIGEIAGRQAELKTARETSEGADVNDIDSELDELAAERKRLEGNA